MSDERNMPPEPQVDVERAVRVRAWLEAAIASNDGVAGTVHEIGADGATLELVAAVNIPPMVQSATRTIPRGKGMAGLAWSREAPVSTCNLQTDATGDVRPGAKAVGAGAAVAAPVRWRGEVRAVVGIAFAQERTFAPEVLAELGSRLEKDYSDAFA